MHNMIVGLLAVLIPCVLTDSSPGAPTAAAAAAATATDILDAAGAQGGIIVHLGCGDGQLTAALGADERFTVHGLTAEVAEVARGRRHVRSKGLYGRVSIEWLAGSTLPYVDNLVNLVVAENRGSVPLEEIMRVLAPGGVAYVKKAGNAWTKTVKPWPENIDQWSHFLHDAGNNAVAADTVVGPPRQLQWLAGPLWLRSHETPAGIQSPVSAGGRLFYFLDEGLIGITDQRLPDRWSLICRDAFNGRLLWKRPLGAWGWRQWSRGRWQDKDWTKLRAGRTDVPPENQRRIVAVGDRVYVTLSYRAPMSILDAATGDVVATIDETLGTNEILVSDGIAVCYTRQVPEDLARRRGFDQTAGSALTAVDGRTGKVLWQKPVGTIRPLALAIDAGRVVFLSGKELVAIRLKDGSPLWMVKPKRTSVRTLVAVGETILLHGGTRVAAHNGADGKFLWEQTGPPIAGGEGDDLFVVAGLVWRGMVCVTDDGKPVRKSANAMVVGWDLRTGEVKKRIRVDNLRSPEHHHRCYRNKATSRYLISSFEGAEFLDFVGNGHSPNNNWLRGVCRYGMTPSNGMLYVPPDQCFCQPGAKLLGYAAITAQSQDPIAEVPDADRLEEGPAYTLPLSALGSRLSEDWPTFRHDAARSGASPARVPAAVAVAWKADLGGRLTAPVVAGGKLFVAQIDAHTVHALDAATGKPVWTFTAGGRIDSPPTVYEGLVLCGSKDGYVYCLRADDGRLAWRFLAAPADRRVGGFDQVESVWPVHGSVLVADGVAYFSAGRSTYLDGGIRVWGLEPATGKVLHKGLLEGPHRELGGERDLAFFIAGANSDVLVSEGGFLYMRQKKMTLSLEEVEVPVLSSKGAQDVGLHVFSTAGLLDDSGYNRTFWMYSRRWPGFQLANQAPKTGQLLVVGPERTFAIRQFYRRNVHSPMFFPAREGYLIFADDNANEPQIVGEPGSCTPVRWLPQSDYFRGRGRGNEVRKLESESFGTDKMIGYTRAEPPLWGTWLPVRVGAMVKTAGTLFVAGEPDTFDPADPYASFENREGARLVALSAADGKKLSELALPVAPVFDGLIATADRLFVSLSDGSVVCLGRK